MKPYVAFSDVSYAYPSRVLGAKRPPALSAITFAIEMGSRVALMGSNGAGKSTLLQLINGTLQPQRGIIEIAGAPIEYSRSKLAQLRRTVSLVFQDPDDQIVAPTVRQDVALGPFNLGIPSTELEARTEECLRLMELSEYANLPPHHLSYGQRKRVAIAGALALQPQLLLLDEPTAGLDSRTTELLLSRLLELNSNGVTMVFSTHDGGFARRFADKFLILEEGRIVDSASSTSQGLSASKETTKPRTGHGVVCPVCGTLSSLDGLR